MITSARTRNQTLVNSVYFIILFIVALLIIFPIVLMALQSFQTNQTLYRWPPTVITTEPTTINWQNLFSRQDLQLPRWIMNSLFVATAQTVVVLIISSMAAYAFARLRFPLRTPLFFLLLITVMIPQQVLLIPNYLTLRDVSLLNTYGGLIWPGVANVFAVFLLRQFFQSIPVELEEAAILDGASRFGVYWRIILPLSVSALVALGIFVFLANWNDLFWPLIVTTDLEMRTLPVGLSILNGTYGPQERGLVLAGALFSTIPVLIVYAIFQRWIIRGVAFTGGLGGR
jgi:multiple sugar transport system permease protein